MLSFNRPTKQEVEAVIPSLMSPQHERYFFERLNNPYWIIPLEEHGYFRRPPRAVRVEGGGVQYLPWPAGKYLVRMASHAPEDIVRIFKSIETDNASVWDDVLEAAMIVPAKLAAELVPTIRRAIDAESLWVEF